MAPDVARVIGTPAEPGSRTATRSSSSSSYFIALAARGPHDGVAHSPISRSNPAAAGPAVNAIVREMIQWPQGTHGGAALDGRVRASDELPDAHSPGRGAAAHLCRPTQTGRPRKILPSGQPGQGPAAEIWTSIWKRDLGSGTPPGSGATPRKLGHRTTRAGRGAPCIDASNHTSGQTEASDSTDQPGRGRSRW